jgi:hypothetical protein
MRDKPIVRDPPYMLLGEMRPAETIMIGVNLYAGQFGTGGTYGKTYVYPGNSYLDYYAS